MAEEDRRRVADAPEPEMDNIRRAIKRVEARRAIIEEQLRAVHTLPDEHRSACMLLLYLTKCQYFFSQNTEIN